MRATRFSIQPVLVFIALASMIGSFLEISRSFNTYQWDLKVYYTAPIEFTWGMNPYTLGKFVYPPLWLHGFKILSLLSLDTTYQAFLLAKIYCFALLLFIWKKFFLKESPLGTFLIFTWLGFYSACHVDFLTGNISVFETLALFLAFVCYLKKHLAAFTALILIVASLKITPLFFLVLLLRDKDERGRRYFLFGCVAFLLYASANYLVYPELTKDFLREALGRINESGPSNHSSLALAGDFLRDFAFLGFHQSLTVATILYAGIAGLILKWSWPLWRKPSPARSDPRMDSVMFLVLIFVIITPRMKDYAYIIAIPSLLYAIQNFKIKVPQSVLFLGLLAIPTKMAVPALLVSVYQEFWIYGPLLTAVLFWFFYIAELSGDGAKNASGGGQIR